MMKHWRNSLTARFTLFTFLITVLLSIGFILVEGYFSIQREYQRMQTQIAQIEESHVPTIVYSLWLTDDELLCSQLNAVARFPYIDYVKVIDDEGGLFQAGNKDSSALSERSRDLYYTRRETQFDVGTLHIYINEEQLWNSALRSEVLSVSGHLISALIIAFAVAFLFNRMVGNHLMQFAEYAEKRREPYSTEAFQLERKGQYNDELQSLVEAVNEMRSSLSGYIEEREILMKEIHHRIKNDLNLINSLLYLQADKTSSEEAAEALEEASNRLAVMSDIYRQVYSHADFSEVELSVVLHNRVKELIQQGNLTPHQIEVSTETVHVPVRVSVAYGIILNELVTNAIKYSAREKQALKISLTLSKNTTEEHFATLLVADNGEGIPQTILDEENLGYGLTIVKALVEQHGGTFLLYNQDGAHIEIVI